MGRMEELIRQFPEPPHSLPTDKAGTIKAARGVRQRSESTDVARRKEFLKQLLTAAPSAMLLQQLCTLASTVPIASLNVSMTSVLDGLAQRTLRTPSACERMHLCFV